MKNLNKLVNWQRCIELAAGKESLAKELLERFMESLPEAHQSISQAYTQNDLKALEEHVHKLHGALCYCAVPDLKEVISNLETAIKQNEQAKIDDLYSKLEKIMENLY